MAECDAPSFSLGLDFSFDLDTPPHSPLRADPPPSASPGDDPGPQVPDPETRPDPPRSILKRLRRGPPPSSVSQQVEPPPCFDADDDIEEFSSQEDPIQGSLLCFFDYFFLSYLPLKYQMYIFLCAKEQVVGQC